MVIIELVTYRIIIGHILIHVTQSAQRKVPHANITPQESTPLRHNPTRNTPLRHNPAGKYPTQTLSCWTISTQENTPLRHNPAGNYPTQTLPCWTISTQESTLLKHVALYPVLRTHQGASRLLPDSPVQFNAISTSPESN